jgi:hypothetical protein
VSVVAPKKQKTTGAGVVIVTEAGVAVQGTGGDQPTTVA